MIPDMYGLITITTKKNQKKEERKESISDRVRKKKRSKTTTQITGAIGKEGGGGEMKKFTETERWRSADGPRF